MHNKLAFKTNVLLALSYLKVIDMSNVSIAISCQEEGQDSSLVDAGQSLRKLIELSKVSMVTLC